MRLQFFGSLGPLLGWKRVIFVTQPGFNLGFLTDISLLYLKGPNTWRNYRYCHFAVWLLSVFSFTTFVRVWFIIFFPVWNIYPLFYLLLRPIFIVSLIFHCFAHGSNSIWMKHSHWNTIKALIFTGVVIWGVEWREIKLFGSCWFNRLSYYNQQTRNATVIFLTKGYFEFHLKLVDLFFFYFGVLACGQKTRTVFYMLFL